jgi:hypothetical protein
MNLPERLQQVINQSKEALALCKSLDGRPNLGLTVMEQYIKQAEEAQVGGDPIAMLRAIKDLEGYTE